MDKVRDYINRNWTHTIKDPKTLKGNIEIDKPFITPSMSGVFTDLYYWDSYFINLGLLKDGMIEQVENNLDNIMTFINKLGFMPNANIILDRSQPPLFSRGVYDFYMFIKNKKIIYKYIDACIKEHSFFEEKRKIKEYDLNFFSTNANMDELKDSYKYLSDRVNEYSDNYEKQLLIGYDLYSIAESGLDFNMRFKTEDNKVAIHEFLQLDINCLMYDMEMKISYLLNEIERFDDSKIFLQYALKRKELINKYLKRNDNIYLDFNYKRNKFSDILTAVSLYPYSFNISNDKEACLKVLSKLEYEYGISFSEYRIDTNYYQFDYPNEWPCIVYFSYIALKNCGLSEDATRIAKKYVEVVRTNFNKTNRIWEKYNAKDGTVAITTEYETPEMLGWSAAVYVYLVDEEKL